MDFAKPFVIGLLTVAVLAALSSLAGKAPPDRRGWRQLAPSAIHWGGLALGVALIGFMAWIRLFVGSSRADAETQMMYLDWLIAGFALMTVGTALGVRALRRWRIRWRGTAITWHRGGHEQTASLADLSRIGRNPLGYTVLHFADGRTIWVDIYARGARELLDAAAGGTEDA